MRFRFLFIFSFLAIMVISCSKDSIFLPDTVLTDLEITQTNTPTAVPRLQSIVSTVHMRAPNLCYRFSHFQVAQINPVLYQINAKATIPNPDKNNAVCLPTVYQKDTTLSIPTTVAGKYVLRFFNGTQLFRVDTVVVN